MPLVNDVNETWSEVKQSGDGGQVSWFPISYPVPRDPKIVTLVVEASPRSSLYHSAEKHVVFISFFIHPLAQSQSVLTEAIGITYNNIKKGHYPAHQRNAMPGLP